MSEIVYYISRYDYEDKEFIQLVEKMHQFFSVNRYSFPEVYIPALKYLKMVPILKNLLARKEVRFKTPRQFLGMPLLLSLLYIRGIIEVVFHFCRCSHFLLPMNI